MQGKLQETTPLPEYVHILYIQLVQTSLPSLGYFLSRWEGSSKLLLPSVVYVTP
jgi:hypothetical protein